MSVKIDRYTLLVGDLLVLLYDGRADSRDRDGMTEASRALAQRCPADPDPRGCGT